MLSETFEMLRQTKQLLADSGIRWAVCGGYALELYLGASIRGHGDLDLSVPEEDREQVRRLMLDKGWRVYEFRGQGRMRPLCPDTPSEKGRNLMCVKDGCELVTFWPCDEPGMVLHEWHPVGIQALNYMEFLFHEESGGSYWFSDALRLPTQRACLSRDGIPYLAPELVLLYKASQPEREANRADYEAVFPRLTEASRAWLLKALPPDHPWAGGARHG